jgi:hypothetical protein
MYSIQKTRSSPTRRCSQTSSATPEYAALVVEDPYRENENDKTGAIIEPGPERPEPQPRESAIVGAATRKLEPGSRRIGQFTDRKDVDSLENPVFDGGLGGDKSKSHVKLLDDKCDASEEEFVSPLITYLDVTI